jgi:valyl-tRNA synthetase
MSEKQRLKHEKFIKKQAQQQQQAISTISKQSKAKTHDASSSTTTGKTSKDWIEETPSGQKKILKPLDDDLHKAYIPKVVESAWYSFWEEQGLFKPRTAEEDGSFKAKGKYVIAIPPPNVRAHFPCI